MKFIVFFLLSMVFVNFSYCEDGNNNDEIIISVRDKNYIDAVVSKHYCYKCSTQNVLCASHEYKMIKNSFSGISVSVRKFAEYGENHNEFNK